jgi:hypothetical protein
MKTDWRDYFYNTFPGELRRFTAERRPEHHCTHCAAPQHRRSLVDGRHLFTLSIKARFCWYALTLIDQGLHVYFRSQSKEWVKATGGYPLPVENTGFGCVAVVPPGYLLMGNESLEAWSDFLDFWLDEMDEKLHPFTGVHPAEFFDAVRNDKGMLNLKKAESFERLLFEKAEAKWTNELKS